MNPDGIFLSNGPGDPAPCDYAIEAIENSLRPIFRYSVSASAISCWRWRAAQETVKMKFGHGGNHPVKDIDNNTVMITAQNHGLR
jgi:carbamoyl-phosphate synthase small subunit